MFWLPVVCCAGQYACSGQCIPKSQCCPDGEGCACDAGRGQIWSAAAALTALDCPDTLVRCKSRQPSRSPLLACAAGLQLCGTDTSTWLCTDLLSDSSHCGSCAAPCPAGNDCKSGMCACSAGRQVKYRLSPLEWEPDGVFRAQLCECAELRSDTTCSVAVCAVLDAVKPTANPSLPPTLQTRRTATVQPRRAALLLASHLQQVRGLVDLMWC